MPAFSHPSSLREVRRSSIHSFFVEQMVKMPAGPALKRSRGPNPLQQTDALWPGSQLKRSSSLLLPTSPPHSFGVIPSTPLAIHTPLMPNQSIDVSLPLNTLGPVMKMEPLNNLQV